MTGMENMAQGDATTAGLMLHPALAGKTTKRVPRYQRKIQRPFSVSPHSCVHTSLIAQAFDWCMPYRKREYPGRRAAFLELLPRAYSWGAVAHWLHSRRPIPVAVANAIAAHIRRQCAAGLAIAAALEDHAKAMAAKPRILTGCCAIDPGTGRDRRGNWRR